MTTSTATEHHDFAPHGAGLPPAGGVLDHIPAVSMEQLLGACSLALDLAEGRAKGHAQRVSYISVTVARAMGLPRPQCSAALHAGLLHDIGVPHATNTVRDFGRGYEHTLFAGSPLRSPEMLAASLDRRRVATVVDAFHEHAFEGATAVAGLGLPAQVAEAILYHHERHDGGGFPMGLAGSDVPLVARIVAAADYAEALLTAGASPLLARRTLESTMREQAGRAFHPQVVEALVRLAHRDEFWLGFHNPALGAILSDLGLDGRRLLSEDETLRVAAAFAEIVDARNRYQHGHSRRVAGRARTLATALGLPDGHARAVELAALLHDIGMLRVPARIIGKPEILTVEEMHLLHEHPAQTAEIVSAVPAWAAIAAWTAAHHERLDGRGYPESLAADEIPLEARILAIADVYEALTADRPHRAALTASEALTEMRGMCGVNVDPAAFAVFEDRCLYLDAPEPAQA